MGWDDGQVDGELVGGLDLCGNPIHDTSQSALPFTIHVSLYPHLQLHRPTPLPSPSPPLSLSSVQITTVLVISPTTILHHALLL